MLEIIPAIIAKDFKELQAKIKIIEPYFEWAQIDVMDGVFTESKSYNAPDTLRLLGTDINFEIHLMIEKPENILDDWISSGAKRILIHYESIKNFGEAVEKIKDFGLEAVAVLKIETPVMVINDFIKQGKIDVIQLMGINKIGYYGEKFDERIFEKIKILRQNYDNITIEIDGGVNPQNAKKLKTLGVARLVIGGYIFNSKDINKAIDELKNIKVL